MNEFKKKGYKIVRNFISKEKARQLYLYAKKREKTSDANWEDQQVLGSPSFYNDHVFQKLQIELLPKLEKESGLKLFKTYTYWRIYKRGAILRTHTDRPACEISVTLNFGGDEWEVWLLNMDEEPISILLEAGDGLIYRGCELNHWRSKFKGNNHMQVFFHYVNRNGPNAWAKDDTIKSKR